MTDVLEQILRNHGPSLSSEVSRILIEEHGMTPAAARQRVRRRPDTIRSLAYLKFPHNARFLYLREEYGAPRFWGKLIAALNEASPAYARALASLWERNKVMPKRHFIIACGAPLAQKRQMSSTAILDRLVQAKLLEELDVPGIGLCVAVAKGAAHLEEPIVAMEARLITEDIVLKAVKTWARNLGLGSYGLFALRDGADMPKVGTFAWDLTAPSYLGPLVDWVGGKPKQGFIVCDILLAV